MIVMANREGKTYRHKMTDAVVLVVKSKPMSHATTRHTVMVLDEGKARGKPAGTQSDVDEVPHDPWSKNWEET